MRKTTFFILLMLMPILFNVGMMPLHAADKKFSQAAIYYNEACGGCNEYLNVKLVPYLRSQGIVVTMRDYVNDKQARYEMNAMQDKLNIPFELQSHIMTFVDNGSLVLGGHVPIDIVKEILGTQNLPKQLVIFQDQMLEMGIDEANVQYMVWQPNYEAKAYDLHTPFNAYLSDWQAGQINRANDKQHSMLPLVLTTGLLDGINPCAIAVLIFFIAFLFTLKGSLRTIIGYGLLYIFVIYVTYLGIGLGLFKAIIISGTPHLMAKIGAWLVIVLGLVNILGHYAPQFPLKLQIPGFSQHALQYWLTKGTLPAVIIGAFLVGLCTFPCSGGIYVAIVGLLASQHTFWQGLGYLLIYNVMFVVPLLVLLALVGNKHALGKVAEWQSHSDKSLKFWSGVVMITLGIIILVWFV